MKKYIILGAIFTNLLTGGVSLNVFATSIDRGVLPMLSVDENTPMSAIPNTGTWCPWTLNSTKYFDISIAGKCEVGAGDRVKLDVQPASKIPDFFTKNSAGKIVFAAPQIVGTIKAAKGHNSWVQINLKTINGDLDSDVAKHVCLGIKKNDEADFFDIIHAGNMTSRYIDITQESYVELVPLLSKTTTTEDTGYVAVAPGDEVAFSDITILTTGEFNFGSVYRVSVSIHDGQWLTDQKCDLNSIVNDKWENIGRMGIGPVTDQNGIVHENQLLAISYNGQLAYSSDGTHWTENGTVGLDCCWRTGPVYGNGIWWAATDAAAICRSTDRARSWSLDRGPTGYAFNFINGVFIAIIDSVYTSPDAENWTNIGSIQYRNGDVLICGDSMWISIGNLCVCQSKDNGKTWEYIGMSLPAPRFFGGCYINGYFYIINPDRLIARSSDGVEWKKVLDFMESNTEADGETYYYNITYYKNKLWAFAQDGSKYVVGLFNPDGTIESLE